MVKALLLADTAGGMPVHRAAGTGAGKSGPVVRPSCGSALKPGLSCAAVGFTIEEKKKGEMYISLKHLRKQHFLIHSVKHRVH